ncbi:glucose/sorbosone dehydrogenase domain protein [Bacteriovorax sp. BSW11_IV]|uniref:PQQ-dependent sugar dehydrogenase n=1 Tax=Bacteriovorax sp. BSW11_IV TaxID=1353529 RepID=UPI000389ED44|nr:PQQ-dependent sugar dehydrogenase [Bacteriovorax sp. BSW11_IV]EQC47845.1 glucose/sorbosone dehydrogenase domain protein [Bacteriovorax sp. BSW11_IV]
MKLSLSFLLLISSLANAELLNSGYAVEKSSTCAGFPRVSISSPQGSCVGLVVDKGEGLKMPRRIVEYRENEFYITDMGSWAKNNGTLWKLVIEENGYKNLTKVLTKLDRPHGLQIGPDGRIYIGEAGRISSIDPTANENIERKDFIVNLPVEGSHPLTHFIFTSQNSVLVNIGAPTDQCLTESGKPIYPCEQYKNEAQVREYLLDDKGNVTGEFVVQGRGLRNSMALAENLFGDFFQGENSMDFKELHEPKEEINLLGNGKHFGWPYCYEKDSLNPKFKKSLFNRKMPKIDCSDYEAPVAFLPSHSAPLDMFFYRGEALSFFKNKLVVSLHGYRETGHRLVAFDLDENERPVGEAKEIINGWEAKVGVRPRGAPVGMSEGSDGKLWFVEDKNGTVMVVAPSLQDDVTTDNNSGQVEYSDLAIGKYEALQKGFFTKNCTSCHQIFEGDSEASIKNLIDSGLVKPRMANSSELYLRILGQGEGRPMPPGANHLLSDEDKELVKDWINSIR